MIRKAAVAGSFYPGSEELLRREVEALVDLHAAKQGAIGVVSPHAGYIYSGAVAGSTLSGIKPRATYVIMGPNHTGMGERFSLSMSGSWATPLGRVEIDKKLAEHILKDSDHIKSDELAHLSEHSIEVQLPFLQVLQKDFKFIPIVVSHADAETYKAIGRKIAKSIKGLKMEKDVTIIASSDMTHYEPVQIAKKKDSEAIDSILKLDEDELMEKIGKLGISMCGYGPVAIMLAAAKELGAKEARLVEYRTSGERSGDYSSVVGYAGIMVT